MRLKSLVIFLFIIGTNITAQKQSLDIGNMKVSLGTSKEIFLQSLLKNYTAKPIENGNVYLIYNNDILYGDVQFDDKEKITILSKYLLLENEKDIYEVISTLFDALRSEIPLRKNSTASIYLADKDNSKFKCRYISIMKDNRSLDITVFKENNNISKVSLKETISQLAVN